MAMTLDGTTGIVLPSGATIPSTVPFFSAWQEQLQNYSAATTTKVLFSAEEFDTNSNFANSRFTPTVAGYYQINASFKVYTPVGFTLGHAVASWIYKNGGEYKGTIQRPGQGNTAAATLSSVMFLNGSTDYIELYGYTDTAGQSIGTLSEGWFNGALIRSI